MKSVLRAKSSSGLYIVCYIQELRLRETLEKDMLYLSGKARVTFLTAMGGSSRKCPPSEVNFSENQKFLISEWHFLCLK